MLESEPQSAVEAILLFEDDFKTWNQSKWTSPFAWNQRERVSNGELQYYADDAIVCNSTGLHIKATPWTSPVAGANYKSGCITTFPRTQGTGFVGRYFYVEARMRLPAGKGLWPAFWTLADGRTGPSKEGTFPHPPELDIMEALGDSMDTLRIHIHADIANGSNKDDAKKGQNFTVPDMSKAFHTYGMDWKPDKCRFYFDDVLKWETSTPDQVNLFDHYLILNLAVGGWAETPLATSFPARFNVNRIRVWDRKP